MAVSHLLTEGQGAQVAVEVEREGTESGENEGGEG